MFRSWPPADSSASVGELGLKLLPDEVMQVPSGPGPQFPAAWPEVGGLRLPLQPHCAQAAQQGAAPTKQASKQNGNKVDRKRTVSLKKNNFFFFTTKLCKSIGKREKSHHQEVDTVEF